MLFNRVNGKCQSNHGTIVSLAFLICCMCTPSVIACPHCGFVINRNTFAASAFILGIVYILCFCALKILMVLSKLKTPRAKQYSLVIAFISGLCFYCWLQSYSGEAYGFEIRMRSALRFGLLKASYEFIIVVGITLPALLLRVYRSRRRSDHFVYSLLGFGLPIFWLYMLIRYTPLIPWDLTLLILILWVTMALLSINAKLFPIMCYVLACGILYFFLASGSFDTLSFTVISLTLTVMLVVLGKSFSKNHQKLTAPASQ